MVQSKETQLYTALKLWNTIHPEYTSLGSICGVESELGVKHTIAGLAIRDKIANPEEVICVHSQDLFRLIDAIIYDRHFERFGIYTLRREETEFCGDDVQLIAGIVLHTNEKILLVEMTKTNSAVEGFRKGVIAAPSGHVKPTVLKFDETGQPMPYYEMSIVDELVENATREFCEEVICNNPPRRNQLHKLVRTAMEERDYSIYPLFTNMPGTMQKHLIVLFDIDAERIPKMRDFLDNFENLICSGEPEKHNVRMFDATEMVREIPFGDIDPYLLLMMQRNSSDWPMKFLNKEFSRTVTDLAGCKVCEA